MAPAAAAGPRLQEERPPTPRMMLRWSKKGGIYGVHYGPDEGKRPVHVGKHELYVACIGESPLLKEGNVKIECNLETWGVLLKKSSHLAVVEQILCFQPKQNHISGFFFCFFYESHAIL